MTACVAMCSFVGLFVPLEDILARGFVGVFGFEEIWKEGCLGEGAGVVVSM